jgi:hypothetical protein
MGKGKERVPHDAVEARKAVLDALQEGRSLSADERLALVDRMAQRYRQAGYSDGYDAGFADGVDSTYDY